MAEMHLLGFFTNIFSGGDGVIILIIVLVIFGPKKLPELARGMGQAIKEFHKAKDEIERELTKTPDVTVQPAPGQQPRQPADLPLPPPPVGLDRQSQAAQVAAAQAARPVEETHPAGQA